MKTAVLKGKYSSVVCKTLIGLFLVAPLAFAQRSQIGGTIGVGNASDGEVGVGPYVVAGVEGCVLCGGRFGLFLEYDHWQLAGSKNNPTLLDLAGGRLRIQGKGARVRPFFDIGVLGGRDQLESPLYSGRHESRSVKGPVFGGGTAISFGKSWYVRPQARIVGVCDVSGGGYVIAWIGVGVGDRF